MTSSLSLSPVLSSPGHGSGRERSPPSSPVFGFHFHPFLILVLEKKTKKWQIEQENPIPARPKSREIPPECHHGPKSREFAPEMTRERSGMSPPTFSSSSSSSFSTFISSGLASPFTSSDFRLVDLRGRHRDGRGAGFAGRVWDLGFGMRERRVTLPTDPLESRLRMDGCRPELRVTRELAGDSAGRAPRPPWVPEASPEGIPAPDPDGNRQTPRPRDPKTLPKGVPPFHPNGNCHTPKQENPKPLPEVIPALDPNRNCHTPRPGDPKILPKEIPTLDPTGMQ